MGQPAARVAGQRRTERARPDLPTGLAPARPAPLKQRITLTLLWLAVVPLSGLWVVGLVTVVRWIF